MTEKIKKIKATSVANLVYLYQVEVYNDDVKNFKSPDQNLLNAAADGLGAWVDKGHTESIANLMARAEVMLIQYKYEFIMTKYQVYNKVISTSPLFTQKVLMLTTREELAIAFLGMKWKI